MATVDIVELPPDKVDDLIDEDYDENDLEDKLSNDIPQPLEIHYFENEDDEPEEMLRKNQN